MRWLAVLLVLAPGVAWAQPAGPPASPPSTWQPRGTADLSVLDKVRAQPSPMSVGVGQSVLFGSLTITVRGCVTRPPDLPRDSAAFIEVVDSRGTFAGFSGWMLASAPALSPMEHPIYDLRVTACR